MNTETQNPTNDQNLNPLEVVAASALEQMERASIDVQITTAKRYPRQLSTVKQQMLSFATLDLETAAGCFFTLPGRKGGDGKPIQGPSIRMAEIAISTFQNLRAGARVIADDGKTITAQGVCHDLQNNVCVTVEVKRRVTTKEGRRYSDDMVVMTGNAACSIALRNATFRVVPLALVKPIYEAAKRVAVGDAKTLVTRRADALAHFTKMGVTKEKVFAAVGGKALEDIGLEQLEILIGYANAIKESDTTIDEVFNKIEETPKTAAEMFTKKPGPAEPADDVPMGGPTPAKVAETAAAKTEPEMVKKPAREETAGQMAKRLILEAEIPFDLIQSEVSARNISKETDTWPDVEAVPSAVWEALGASQTKLTNMIKKFGKKNN